jgi:DNA repair protein RadC
MKTVATSRAAEELLHGDLYGLDHEEAWLIYLTSHNQVIGTEMVSKGTLDKTSIDCRTILRQALLHNAAAIIVLHNHPSGASVPSSHDVFFTSKLREACVLMDIRLTDHIIVGEEEFYSFCDERTFKI